MTETFYLIAVLLIFRIFFICKRLKFLYIEFLKTCSGQVKESNVMLFFRLVMIILLALFVTLDWIFGITYMIVAAFNEPKFHIFILIFGLILASSEVLYRALKKAL
jgi:hypothetical protein